MPFEDNVIDTGRFSSKNVKQLPWRDDQAYTVEDTVTVKVCTMSSKPRSGLLTVPLVVEY